MSKTVYRGMLMSHAQRMCEQPVSYPTSFASDYEARTVEDTLVNGRVVKKSVYRTVHPQDNFKGFVASDFALENIIAAGAIGALKESYLNVNTSGELSDSMESSIDNAIAAVDAAENNAQTTNE